MKISSLNDLNQKEEADCRRYSFKRWEEEVFRIKSNEPENQKIYKKFRDCSTSKKQA